MNRGRNGPWRYRMMIEGERLRGLSRSLFAAAASDSRRRLGKVGAVGRAVIADSFLAIVFLVLYIIKHHV